MDTWESFRAEFPVTDQLTYLNHAAVSPLPRRCTARVQAYLDELGQFGAFHYPGRVMETLIEARRMGADLMHTRPERVFLVKSTSQGLGIAATGIPFREGDNLVLVDREFPANLRPWMPLKRRGVEVRLVQQRDGRVLLDDLREAVDARTAALSVSFVQFLSGFRLDVGAVSEICRRHDALFVVDAIQGLGVFPLDVEAAGIDFLSADSHKWLLGPEGIGLGYASDRALGRIEQALEGWIAVERPFDMFDLAQPLKPTAARYEEGAYNSAGVNGMLGSLELILEIGVDRLAERILALTDHVVEGLRRKGWQVLSPREHEGEKSGIVLAQKPDCADCDALNKRLHEENFALSVRDGALRISPHGYNTFAELDRLVDLLD